MFLTSGFLSASWRIGMTYIVFPKKEGERTFFIPRGGEVGYLMGCPVAGIPAIGNTVPSPRVHREGEGATLTLFDRRLPDSGTESDQRPRKSVCSRVTSKVTYLFRIVQNGQEISNAPSGTNGSPLYVM
ncbi:hypothetical protein HYW94_00775 [Candidatus Uhrbacteria bacterium]|nr:hypothetical protein [Candidatus Uhrbacteria bacterium]